MRQGTLLWEARSPLFPHLSLQGRKKLKTKDKSKEKKGGINTLFSTLPSLYNRQRIYGVALRHRRLSVTFRDSRGLRERADFPDLIFPHFASCRGRTNVLFFNLSLISTFGDAALSFFTRHSNSTFPTLCICLMVRQSPPHARESRDAPWIDVAVRVFCRIMTSILTHLENGTRQLPGHLAELGVCSQLNLPTV